MGFIGWIKKLLSKKPKINTDWKSQWISAEFGYVYNADVGVISASIIDPSGSVQVEFHRVISKTKYILTDRLMSLHGLYIVLEYLTSNYQLIERPISLYLYDKKLLKDLYKENFKDLDYPNQFDSVVNTLGSFIAGGVPVYITFKPPEPSCIIRSRIKFSNIISNKE